uniref:Spo11/DNA topoisomerase VI subunit A N-terminal domain-containing protein n=1 Tax=Globisporangium ultimum (strain ATCC 200006 / CBS 805.95 / DAOM BR144) TaxID=431595 RepID=K3XBK5_GLOUD
REIYYLHPFFKAQQEADEAILDAGSILGVPRNCMNIVGATKGCFVGRMRILKNCEWLDCGNGDEYPITQQLL